jgi:hypothetical protein
MLASPVIGMEKSDKDTPSAPPARAPASVPASAVADPSVRGPQPTAAPMPLPIAAPAQAPMAPPPSLKLLPAVLLVSLLPAPEDLNTRGKWTVVEEKCDKPDHYQVSVQVALAEWVSMPCSVTFSDPFYDISPKLDNKSFRVKQLHDYSFDPPSLPSYIKISYWVDVIPLGNYVGQCIKMGIKAHLPEGYGWVPIFNERGEKTFLGLPIDEVKKQEEQDAVKGKK